MSELTANASNNPPELRWLRAAGLLEGRASILTGGIFYKVARMARKSLASYFDSETKGKTQPTTASPGSVRKQVVFAIRVWRDEELHHMDDRKERDHDTHQAVEVRRRLRSAVREFLALREAVPEINGEVLEAVATGRLSFEVLEKIREI